VNARALDQIVRPIGNETIVGFRPPPSLIQTGWSDDEKIVNEASIMKLTEVVSDNFGLPRSHRHAEAEGMTVRRVADSGESFRLLDARLAL
jgi:hypothetical protein